LLGTPPTTLAAGQSVTLYYKLTCLQSLAPPGTTSLNRPGGAFVQSNVEQHPMPIRLRLMSLAFGQTAPGGTSYGANVSATYSATCSNGTTFNGNASETFSYIGAANPQAAQKQAQNVVSQQNQSGASGGNGGASPIGTPPAPKCQATCSIDIYNLPEKAKDSTGVQNKQNPGALLFLDYDDDNNDGIYDKDEDATVTSYPYSSKMTYSSQEWLLVTLTCSGQNGQLILNVPQNGTEIRVWEQSGTSLVKSKCTWTLGNSSGVTMPITVYIQGLVKSSSSGDVNLTLKYQGNDNSTAQDQANLTVVDSTILTDYNRDGIINLDKTGKSADLGKISTTNPWRFWINDDCSLGDQYENDVPGAFSNVQSGITVPSTLTIGLTIDGVQLPPTFHNQDSSTNLYGQGLIRGTRDLGDYFPLCLDLTDLLSKFSGSIPDLYLCNADEALDVAFASPYETPQSSRNYLIDLKTVNDQLANYSTTYETTAAPTLGANSTPTISPLIIPSKNISNTPMFLVGARAQTTNPLRMVICIKGTTTEIGELQFPLSISGVENMYRSKNFMDVDGITGALAGRPDALGIPSNYPDSLTDNNSFVCVHGYNVNPQQARGWDTRVFKNMWWSGFHGKFYGVIWHGADSQVANTVTVDYQINIEHAFAAAPAFATFINSLTGNVTIQAHSLGNMLVGAAIQLPGSQSGTPGISPVNYFMNDAAVAKEAYDPTELQIGNDATALDVRAGDDVPVDMRSPDWVNYPAFYYCSNWYQLFPASDARSTLTWRGQLGNVLTSGINVYNFYSSGEDVLANKSGAPPSIASIVSTFGAYTWNAQERYKGLMTLGLTSDVVSSTGNILSSRYGGWAFNLGDPTPPNTNSLPTYYQQIITQNGYGVPDTITRYPNTPSQLSSTLTPGLQSQLQQWPLFYPGFDPNPNDGGSSFSGPTWIQNLFDPQQGSQTALANQKQLLSEMIPAESAAAGANPFKATALVPAHQVDMNALQPNGWSNERTTAFWLHSDMQAMSYFYTYRLYDTFEHEIYYPGTPYNP
jgi:hypothetical protein